MTTRTFLPIVSSTLYILEVLLETFIPSWFISVPYKVLLETFIPSWFISVPYKVCRFLCEWDTPEGEYNYPNSQ